MSLGDFLFQPKSHVPAIAFSSKDVVAVFPRELLSCINKNLEQARQDDAAGSWAKLCIYRVPHYLREGDDKAYVPQLVSLASHHHGKNRLRQMDRHKWRSLHHVLKRTNKDIKLFLDSIRELEEKAHSCYEVSIAVNSNEFVEMMVLDGCFVLELAAEGFKQLGNAGNDPVYIFKIK
ncbi:UPF0481 protein At3g47200-like [Hevea brasiliensis]|uniref:UPF0481 protein At3g47200-like n=1 Tax=Hevea brasiliensis TaxID=3981 RepID=UPI0025D7DFDA|nr:UPF0481 protein At3g47200-like [Hevea brasiliensis]